jgi:signal transduction histidine kinase
MLLFSDSLAARIVAVILGSFAALAVLVTALMLLPGPHDPGQGLFDLPVPQEAAAMVEALEAAGPAERPLILNALNNGITAVHVEPDFPPVAAGLRRAPELEWLFARYSRLLDGRPFRVEQRRGPFARLFRGVGRARPEASVRMLVALRGGGVLVIEHRPPQIVRSYLARSAATVALAALVLLAGLAVAVRQAASPVARLAQAARRFSIDRAAPDLPLGGPREIRELSAAFNDLQSRIRGLVQERTRLLAAIAHDLRTYLTRLRLRVEFIADEDQRERAQRDIEEMALLLDDTLTFARQTAGDAAAPAACDAAAEVAALVEERRELGQPVRLAAAPSSLSAACSGLALRRMLANLVDNAVRYGERAEIAVCSRGEAVEIEVTDAGPGVPEAALARIADPFERLETSRGRETGGAGLGLAIVKGLAESCGGALELANGEAGGLKATIRLPAARDPNPRPSSAQR